MWVYVNGSQLLNFQRYINIMSKIINVLSYFQKGDHFNKAHLLDKINSKSIEQVIW